MFSTEKNCVEVIYSFEEKNLTYLRRPNPQFPQKFWTLKSSCVCPRFFQPFRPIVDRRWCNPIRIWPIDYRYRSRLTCSFQAKESFPFSMSKYWESTIPNICDKKSIIKGSSIHEVFSILTFIDTPLQHFKKDSKCIVTPKTYTNFYSRVTYFCKTQVHCGLVFDMKWNSKLSTKWP